MQPLPCWQRDSFHCSATFPQLKFSVRLRCGSGSCLWPGGPGRSPRPGNRSRGSLCGSAGASPSPGGQGSGAGRAAPASRPLSSPFPRSRLLCAEPGVKGRRRPRSRQEPAAIGLGTGAVAAPVAKALPGTETQTRRTDRHGQRGLGAAFAAPLLPAPCSAPGSARPRLPDGGRPRARLSPARLPELAPSRRRGSAAALSRGISPCAAGSAEPPAARGTAAAAGGDQLEPPPPEPFMASHQQTRIQAYLEKNKIGPLFEVRRAPPRR